MTNRGRVNMVERPGTSHRHIAMIGGAGETRILCRTMPGTEPWSVVQPDPASAAPMCSACLKAATRVADLADRQEGISDDD